MTKLKGNATNEDVGQGHISPINMFANRKSDKAERADNSSTVPPTSRLPIGSINAT